MRAILIDIAWYSGENWFNLSVKKSCVAEHTVGLEGWLTDYHSHQSQQWSRRRDTGARQEENARHSTYLSGSSYEDEDDDDADGDDGGDDGDGR